MNERDLLRRIVKRDENLIEHLVVIIEERTGCIGKITFIGEYTLVFLNEKEG